MKYLFIVAIATITLFSCQKEIHKDWQLTHQISIEGVNPIGITNYNNTIWLSDGDHNRLVSIDENGNITKSIEGFERPMHIDSDASKILVPEYGSDAIIVLKEEIKDTLKISDSLDAPAGVSVYNNEVAIADFYNNRILYNNGTKWISFGKEGKAHGDFYYPTDVQILESEIWVADAYNNRIQVFDKAGKFLKVIGEDQKMNAATGLFVSNNEVFVTDFENDRVLVFDLDGNLKQELSDKVEKPTDIMLKEGKLYIINYRTGNLNAYEVKEAEIHSEEGHPDGHNH